MIRPADTVVILLAIVGIVTLAVSQWRAPVAAGHVEIGSVDGMLTKSLAEDSRIEVTGPLGISVIEIDDGRVRFLSAPCRHRVCIRTGWLEQDGDFAACVPNRVTLRAVAEVSRFDAINY